jgi:hypothetical protein
MEANTESTDTQAETKGQAQETQEKFYSQKEFDDAMAKMRHAVAQKAIKPYQELGDIEELRSLKQAQERARNEEAMKKGQFEQLLQEMAAKKDAEISKRDSIIKEYKVDTPLLNAAARYRSVSPEQVKALLKGNVRLGEQGEVEVVDTNGQIRYNDSGVPLGVDDLVSEFLQQNPHFVQPTPATTNTKSSYDNSLSEIDITKLDMSNPKHRERYAKWREAKRA